MKPYFLRKGWIPQVLISVEYGEKFIYENVSYNNEVKQELNVWLGAFLASRNIKYYYQL